MKASRITAIGLVAAAALWIASGHFLPHETAESRAAISPGEGAAKKLFRVAVAETRVVAHSRKLTLSGRTEADKRVTVTARTGGVLTELRVRRRQRRQQGRRARHPVGRGARGAGGAGALAGAPAAHGI
jgi:multidrug efflux system membrane fusion protein